MNGSAEEQDLKDRLQLIEQMIAEGRRTTERWGWLFVFWGVAYYIAIAWADWGHSTIAWPVTMIVAAVLCSVLATRSMSRRPETTMGRAIGAVWIGMGISIFLLLMSLGVSGRYEPHTFLAIIGAMLGGSNATSSIVLKWKAQFGCAVVWWTAALIGVFGSDSAGLVAFLVAIFICQILFGIYGLLCEGRKHGGAHA
jgi:hypothetical protein